MSRLRIAGLALTALFAVGMFTSVARAQSGSAGGEEGVAAGEPYPNMPSESVAQQPPSDANIGAIVLAANQIDIDYGKLALTESKNKEVLAFAQQMVTDHGAVQKSVIELAGKLQLTPIENDTSNSLKAKSVEVTAKLKSLHGKAFDRFYIDNEVAYHKQVTDAIAGVLIPNAQNLELKAALQGSDSLSRPS